MVTTATGNGAGPGDGSTWLSYGVAFDPNDKAYGGSFTNVGSFATPTFALGVEEPATRGTFHAYSVTGELAFTLKPGQMARGNLGGLVPLFFNAGAQGLRPPNPEPSSLVLAVVGLPIFLARGLRRVRPTVQPHRDRPASDQVS
jgi:hypothetical protein